MVRTVKTINDLSYITISVQSNVAPAGNSVTSNVRQNMANPLIYVLELINLSITNNAHLVPVLNGIMEIGLFAPLDVDLAPNDV